MNWNACLKCVSEFVVIPKTPYSIVFERYQVKDPILKCTTSAKNKEKIADSGDFVKVIHSDAIPSGKNDELDCWLVVESKTAARNDVLWCRPKADIQGKCEFDSCTREEFLVTKIGKFGSKESREDCFFLKIGRRKETKKEKEKGSGEIGVWISTFYYNTKIRHFDHNVLVPTNFAKWKSDGKGSYPLQPTAQVAQVPIQFTQPNQCPQAPFQFTCPHCNVLIQGFPVYSVDGMIQGMTPTQIPPLQTLQTPPAQDQTQTPVSHSADETEDFQTSQTEDALNDDGSVACPYMYTGTGFTYSEYAF